LVPPRLGGARHGLRRGRVGRNQPGSQLVGPRPAPAVAGAGAGFVGDAEEPMTMAADRTKGHEESDVDADVIDRKVHYWRWIVAVLLVGVLVSFVATILSSPNLDVDTIVEYLFAPEILSGVVVTLELTA